MMPVNAGEGSPLSVRGCRAGEGLPFTPLPSTPSWNKPHFWDTQDPAGKGLGGQDMSPGRGGSF